MIHPVNQLYTYNYILRNSQGNLIYDGSPYCAIQNKDSSTWWNGIAWDSEEVFLSMVNNGDGTYSYGITFDTEGLYEIKASDVYYKDSLDVIEIKVSSGEYKFVGETFVISKQILNEDGTVNMMASPRASIQRASDNLFFNEIEWQEEFYDLEMALATVSGLVAYTAEFTYNEPESFNITVVDVLSGTNESYKLTYSDTLFEGSSPDANGLFELSSETMPGTSGTGSVLLDEYGKPVSGVIIKLHNKGTGEVFRTVSNTLGKWKIWLPKGDYVIIFSHDNFKSVSIERVVN